MNLTFMSIKTLTFQLTIKNVPRVTDQTYMFNYNPYVAVCLNVQACMVPVKNSITET